MKTVGNICLILILLGFLFLGFKSCQMDVACRDKGGILLKGDCIKVEKL
jgi:membrane-bound ClpP family serine protease